MFFFFKQKTAYEMRISDWSSDVCSSDLHAHVALPVLPNDDRFLDLLQLLDLAVDLSRADANAARVQRGVGAPVDDDAVVLGQLDEVAVVPDVRSEEHTSELQSLMRISYAVFCLQNKIKSHITRDSNALRIELPLT